MNYLKFDFNETDDFLLIVERQPKVSGKTNIAAGVILVRHLHLYFPIILFCKGIYNRLPLIMSYLLDINLAL